MFASGLHPRERACEHAIEAVHYVEYEAKSTELTCLRQPKPELDGIDRSRHVLRILTAKHSGYKNSCEFDRRCRKTNAESTSDV
jgi:hypothetical protein